MRGLEHECRELPHPGLTTNYTPDSAVAHKKSLNTGSYIEKNEIIKKWHNLCCYISTKQKEKMSQIIKR
jgi:hypothetical protein